MVGRVDFTIRGAKELEKTLKELGPQIASRLGDRALRAGAKPIVKEAKRLTPRRTGNLRKSIKAVKARERGGAYAATRTVLIGFKKPHSRRAHLTEFGFVHRNGKHVAARPFIRPALDATAGEALRAMIEDMSRGILRAEWKQTLGLLAEGQEIDFGVD